MSERDPLTMIAMIAGSLAALILAWRAYRGASAEHERRKRERERKD